MTPYQEGCLEDGKRWTRIARTEKQRGRAIKVPKVPALTPEGMSAPAMTAFQREVAKRIRQRVRASSRSAKAEGVARTFFRRSHV